LFQPHAPADAVRVPPPSANATATATANIANFFFEALLVVIYFLLCSYALIQLWSKNLF
jgi:hypothetical protein